MPEPVLQSFLQFLEFIMGHAVGTTQFYFMIAVGSVSLVVTARVLAGMFGSDSGLVGSAFAATLPVVIALVARCLFYVYGLPHLEGHGWAEKYLPWIILWLALFVTVLTMSATIWEMRRASTMLVFVVALIVSISSSVIVSGMFDMLDRGTGVVEAVTEHEEE